LSATVSIGKIRRPSGTWAIPRATTSYAGRPVSGVPSNDSEPLRGAIMPEITRSSVVLPAPLGPTTATASRSATSRLTSHKAVKAP